MGFYGWGFLHAIGGLGEAATETLRALINAAHFASMQGGFRSNDVNIPAGELAFRPGEYKGVNATTDDLKKAFFIPPFKEPSPALFQCLNLIVESGRRYAGTMEVVLGDAATSAPVGTTLALIEQSGKLFSGIHKRLHAAMSEEFRQRAALNGTYLPDSYPYAVRGAQNGVFRADFDERLDIIPVSDPNITTQAQRIVLAQTIKQLAEEAPDLYDRRAVHMRMHEAIRTPSIEEIMPPPEQVQPMDPVTEGQRIMQQQPVQAFPEQNHDAHLVVHQALMAQVQAMPSVQQVMPALLAHMAEHFALRYRVAIEQAIGMPLVNVPPEAQEQVAMLAAQAIQRVQAAAALASAATQAAQAQAGAPANGQARPGYTQ
jgi:hypothetical protein